MLKNSNYIPLAINKLHKKITPIKGIGSYIYTKNSKYLDFTSGIGALSTGHTHPYIISCVKNQLDTIVHAQQQIFGSHLPQIDLNNKLIKIMPSKSLDTVFYTSSGSEATDNAIRIARRYTGKTNIISLLGGFHGRTMGALSVTSSNLSCKFKSQPLLPGVFFCQEPTIQSLDKVLSYNSSPDETAAIIVEPIQGEGGINALPTEFLKYIETIANENNILMISDEIQCGSGRTGTWWNIEQHNINPDLLLFGKGIASGFPLAGVAGREEIFNNIGNSYLGGTYGGNAIASMAASATIDVFDKENLLQNTIDMGELFLRKIQDIEELEEVKQYGLMIAIKIKNIESSQIVNKLRFNKVLALLAGNNNQYVRLLPPLNITEDEIDFFIDALKKSIKQAK